MTATRTEGLRLFASGESDLHCAGIDSGDLLPSSLRRERFLDMTAVIVAPRDHPLLSRDIRTQDLVRCPWIDFDAAATTVPCDGRPSLPVLLKQLQDTTHTHVKTIIRASTAGIYLLARGPYLAWLSTTFLEGLPGMFLRPLPITSGRYRSRTGFVARRSAEDVPPFKRFEAIVRGTALGHPH